MAFMDYLEFGEEAAEILQSMTVLVFFGLFGYAYCKQNLAENENSAEKSMDLDDIDFTNGVSKKDMKALKNLKKDLDKKMDKVAKDVEKFTKLEEKMKKMETGGNLSSSQSQVDDSKKPAQTATYAAVVADKS